MTDGLDLAEDTCRSFWRQIATQDASWTLHTIMMMMTTNVSHNLANKGDY